MAAQLLWDDPWKRPSAACASSPGLSKAGPDMIATADGLADLTNSVTNIKAQHTMLSFDLHIGQQLDLGTDRRLHLSCVSNIRLISWMLSQRAVP